MNKTLFFLILALISFSLRAQAEICPAANSFHCDWENQWPMGSAYVCESGSWSDVSPTNGVREFIFATIANSQGGLVTCNYLLSNGQILAAMSYAHPFTSPGKGKWTDCGTDKCCYSGRPSDCQFNDK